MPPFGRVPCGVAWERPSHPPATRGHGGCPGPTCEVGLYWWWRVLLKLPARRVPCPSGGRVSTLRLPYEDRRGTPTADPSGSHSPVATVGCVRQRGASGPGLEPPRAAAVRPPGLVSMVPGRIGSERRLARFGQAGWPASGGRPVGVLSRAGIFPRVSMTAWGPGQYPSGDHHLANPTGLDTCPALARSQLGVPPWRLPAECPVGSNPQPFRSVATRCLRAG